MSVNLYYTQKVRGFQQQSVKYSANSVRISLKRTKFQCPRCGYGGVTVEPVSHRRVRGSPMGECRETILEFETHRLYCPAAKAELWNTHSFSFPAYGAHNQSLGTNHLGTASSNDYEQ